MACGTHVAAISNRPYFLQVIRSLVSSDHEPPGGNSSNFSITVTIQHITMVVWLHLLTGGRVARYVCHIESGPRTT